MHVRPDMRVIAAPSEGDGTVAHHRVSTTPPLPLDFPSGGGAAIRRPVGPSSDDGRAPRAVVVGAGFGGMAAALRLRALGHRVTLVDRIDQLGGRGRVHRCNGYTFDAGPTVITAPWLFSELFELFGRRLEDEVVFTPVDPWYRIIFDDGSHFDYGESIDHAIEQIREMSPRDVDGFLRMMKRCERIYEVGFERLGDVPFLSLGTMLAAVPQMIRLGSFRSTWGFVSQHLRDHRLRRVFSFQPLLVGGNPLTTTSIYALIQIVERRFGIHYTMGGTGALVAALGRLMSDVGIDIRLGADVTRIACTGGSVRGVELADGTTIPADRVVCNADPVSVYQRLLPDEPAASAGRRKARRMRMSMGLFVAYFGTDRTYENLAHHTIVLSDRYEGLLRDIFGRDRLPQDPSLYVHAPTRTDPSMAPEGHECFYALAPVPNLDAGIDWSREGDRYRDLVLDRIERMMAPGLRASLDTCFYSTPETFRDDFLSPAGAGFSVQPLLTQSAWFRFHARCPRVGGLYFVGAGTHPGAGLPGVTMSARVLERVLREEGAVHR
jgi:phytoene desaturase